ncbi:hypothetical protein QFC21_003989 [Naganishia friedmannii]|uniref:Uncharacterized protein n=1 Tax=Naganishia friedmannii TaxID=89922 RepID=A0ACC2VJ46_9TREE|nr:hypothetical protein QFC21_003989 [Naganishia friedmannii]
MLVNAIPASEPNDDLRVQHKVEDLSSNSTEPTRSGAALPDPDATSSEVHIVSSGGVGTSTSEITASSSDVLASSSTESHASATSDTPGLSTSSEIPSYASSQPTESGSAEFALSSPIPTTSSSLVTPTTSYSQGSQASASSSAVFVTITHTPASIITPAAAANQAPAPAGGIYAPLGTPVNGKAAAAPAGGAVSYVIDPKPAVVTLQVVDGKLVPAGSAPAAYSIALPGVAGLGGVQGKAIAGGAAGVDADDIVDAALNAPNLHYANPLMNLASEIVILTQPKTAGCNMQCLPFRTNIVKCNTDFPLITADLKTSSTADTQKTNTSLTACICEPFIQRGSCEACLSKNSTLAAMPQMAYFSGIDSRCPAIGQASAGSSSRGALPSILSDSDGTTANDNPLQGVDKNLLAAVCNGTGLATSDPKTYDSCKNGLNVAAILNTTDDMLRQKIPAWKGSLQSPGASPSASNVGNGSANPSVAEYCAVVHVNDWFWEKTCGSVGSLQGAGSRFLLAAMVMSTGVWLLL